jgi:hypothetical protein
MASTGVGNVDEEKRNVADSTAVVHEEDWGLKETTEEEILEDPETKRKKRRLLWKIDLFVLPVLIMVYFFGTMVR